MMGFGDPAVLEWSLAEEGADPIVRQAVEAGITFFDTANYYSQGASEEVTGRLLHKFLSRDEFVVATKVCMPMSDNPNDRGLSRKHVLSSVDASLTRLGMDYVDLYQVHRWDPSTPIEETMEALHDIVRAGKARYIGASSMFAWQFAKAQHVAERHGWTRFVSMQNHYNLVYREEEREMIPQCVDQGVAVIPWGPLAGGFLAGNRGRDGELHTQRARKDEHNRRLYRHPSDEEVIDQLSQIAAEHDVGPAQVALSWLLHKPAVTAPIVGASKPSHVDDAVAALAVALTTDEVRRLEKPYEPHRIAGHF
jgi:aryl-alcohol dehydrogenase-like predicted oxidoreductase